MLTRTGVASRPENRHGERLVTFERVVGASIWVATAKGRIVDPVSEQNGLQINWVNSAGGALGAVSSAILLSSLGAAGTLVGAALGSLCITVGGAVYSHYLTMTKERVTSQALAARRPGRVREPVPAGAGAVAQSEDRWRTEDPDHTDRADEERSVGQLLPGLPWKQILAISAAFFGIAMVLIVAFELSTGRAVSTYTGGTSNTSVGTSIPGWSGTGQESPDVEVDVPLPGDVQDGDDPQDQAPPEEDGPQEQAPQEQAPQEQAPQEDGPQEQAPPQEDGPQEQAPPQEAPQQEQAPPQEAPQQEQAPPQEAPQQEPSPQPAPAAPAP